MEWTKEKLIDTLDDIIKSSESEEEAFEEANNLFYNLLSKDNLIDILLDFMVEDYDKNLDKVYSFGSEKPDLKIVH